MALKNHFQMAHKSAFFLRRKYTNSLITLEQNKPLSNLSIAYMQNETIYRNKSLVEVPFVVYMNDEEDGSCKVSQDQRDSGDIEVFQYSLFGAKSSLARCAL